MQTTAFVMGRNNKISAKQRASLEGFLASTQGLSWLARISISERLIMAKSGWSALANGKDLDTAFVAAWNAWAATLEVAPPKSHMWSKGAVSVALGA
jgi:hypothetical protein